ncbi:hypothetical protein GQ600_18153 [Phytophthora cactorum]|nr:hypothetical protein GQ600_18153 [Phytophthora cactorum]
MCTRRWPGGEKRAALTLDQIHTDPFPQFLWTTCSANLRAVAGCPCARGGPSCSSCTHEKFHQALQTCRMGGKLKMRFGTAASLRARPSPCGFAITLMTSALRSYARPIRRLGGSLKR